VCARPLRTTKPVNDGGVARVASRTIRPDGRLQILRQGRSSRYPSHAGAPGTVDESLPQTFTYEVARCSTLWSSGGCAKRKPPSPHKASARPGGFLDRHLLTRQPELLEADQGCPRPRMVLVTETTDPPGIRLSGHLNSHSPQMGPGAAEVTTGPVYRADGGAPRFEPAIDGDFMDERRGICPRRCNDCRQNGVVRHIQWVPRIRCTQVDRDCFPALDGHGLSRRASL